MSDPILSAESASAKARAAGGGGASRVSSIGSSPGILARRWAGAERYSALRPETQMFQDTARTMLPIEFQGREVQLEAHAYEDETASYQAMALVHRIENGKVELPIVRVHSGCVTGDIFHSLRCDCHQQLQKALERITASSHGVIIYLPHHEGRGIGLVNKIKAYAAQDRGLDTVDANLSIGAPVDARNYELAAKILKHMGCTEVRLLTNNPLKVAALEGHGVSVLEQVPHVITASRYNARYLATKRERMSHKL